MERFKIIQLGEELNELICIGKGAFLVDPDIQKIKRPKIAKNIHLSLQLCLIVFLIKKHKIKEIEFLTFT